MTMTHDEDRRIDGAVFVVRLIPCLTLSVKCSKFSADILVKSVDFSIFLVGGVWNWTSEVFLSS